MGGRVARRWSSAAACGTLLAACASSLPPVPMDRFLAGDLSAVRGFYDEQLREGDVQSGALFMNGLAQIEMLQGEIRAARTHFLSA